MTVRVLAATGSVGLAPSDPQRSFLPALEYRPDVIVADAGSADIGPSYLGSNRAYNDPAWEEGDLDHLVAGALQLDVPLIVGSCGVHGSNDGVERYVGMVDRVLRRTGKSARTAIICAEFTRTWLHETLDRVGVISALAPLPDLTHGAVDCSDHLVAVMGAFPIVEALRQGAQIVLAGRATDDGLFAAMPLLRGLPPASAYLAGKLLENASLVASPFIIRECVIADVDDGGVTLTPVLPEQRCTRLSVAAELMYERRTPYEQAGPEGVLEMHDVRIEELDGRRARVSGARFRSTAPTVKVEGAGFVGYRSVTLAGCRDPRMIAHLDSVLELVRGRVRDTGADVAVHVFGRDAVMGALEPERHVPHEVAVVIETVASTQDEATRGCLLAKRLLFTTKYPGQKATAGSVTAMLDEYWEAGPAYRWTVNHVVPVADPVELFPIEFRALGAVA